MEMEICPSYISKYNSNRQTQITLLMIPNQKIVCIIKRNKLNI